MRPMASRKSPSESSDEVGLIVALLVRFPEIATLVAHPTDGTLVLSFAVAKRLDRQAEREVRDTVVDHVQSLLELASDQPDVLSVTCERDDHVTFVHVTRDAKSFTAEELTLLTALLAERFGEKLVKSPTGDEADEEEVRAQDESVEYALEALRDPSQQRSLMGFREEKQVLVYFVKSRKKAKARGR